MRFESPILYLIFNRPDLIEITFEKIKEVRPKYLYIAADGPRVYNINDKKLCEDARNKVLSMIDWDCQVKTLFRNENLGCREAIFSALDWFFSQVEYGIVIEDDCLCDKSFFYFSQEMLNKYRTVETVKQISGTNYLFDKFNKINSYFFSHYMPVWGWASWRRVWDEFKSDFFDINKNDYVIKLKKIYQNKIFYHWLLNIYEKSYIGEIDSWAILFQSVIVMNDGIGIVPYRNLVSNVGTLGTHGNGKKDRNLFRKITTIDINNLRYPESICINKRMHCITIKEIVKSVELSMFDKSLNYIKRNLKEYIKRNYNESIVYKAISEKRNKTGILKNVFKSEYNKRVLVSYLTTPFTHSKSYKHSNNFECLVACCIFHELGYKIDVVDWLYLDNIDFSRYKVIYGFGKPFERAFYYKETNQIIKILYSPGCNTSYSDMISLSRLLEFKQKTNLFIPQSIRLSKFSSNLQRNLSDKIIVLGKEFVINTFKKNDICKKISSVRSFYFNTYKVDLNFKKINEVKKHFLWFGSSGAIHKGLDLLIEIFKKRKDLYLHICGLNKNEEKFIDYYREDLIRENIINHGFVNIKSVKFRDLMYKCGAAILPSASEGGAPSVVNVVANGGLIPIITESCGLDLPKSEYLISELNVEVIENIIDKYLNKSSLDLKKDAILFKDFFTKNYTIENYYRSLKKEIRDILD